MGITDDSDDEFVVGVVHSDQKRVVHDEVFGEELSVVCYGRCQNGLRMWIDV